MVRRGRGVFACAIALVVLSVPSLASAEIARPPGANPSNRGYELVSLPDTGGQPMGLGTGIGQETLQRRPALARTGGLAIVASGLPIDGQRDSGGISAFRSVRQSSGSWTQTFTGLSQRRSAFDSFATPVGWTPDFTTTLWSTSGKYTDPDDPSPSLYYDQIVGLQRQPLGGTSREQFNTGSYAVDQGNATDNPVGILSDDGRTVTFSRRGTSFAPNTPLSSIYRRTDDGPVQLVSEGPTGTPLDYPSIDRVSPDATRVAMSSADGISSFGTLKRLYLRDGNTTVSVDEAQQPLATRTNTQYVGGSADLSTIYFLTRDQLVQGDTDQDADLYRYTGGDLQLVSRGTGPGGNGTSADCPTALPNTQVANSARDCDVAFLGTNDSGNLAYFLSPERLDGAADAELGGANVYVRDGQGAIRFVMTLDPSDSVLQSRTFPSYNFNRDFGIEGGNSVLIRTLNDSASATPFSTAQILRVDQQTLKATCISCGGDGSGSASEARLNSDTGTSSAPAPNSGPADGSHLYFDTAARLVPEDTNTAVDVYDYDVATGARTLVSAGTTRTDSFFAGTSGDGADVMIVTQDTLVAADRNGPILKVYDARRDGGQEAPSTTPPVQCGDDSCKPPAALPPAFADPQSGVLGTSRGNVTSQPAVRVAVGSVSAAQRRALVRTGKVNLDVRTSAAATVRVKAQAQVGRRTSTVASGSARLRRAGTARVALKLSAAARRELRRKGALRVVFTASAPGSATKTLTLSLRAITDKKAGAR